MEEKPDHKGHQSTRREIFKKAGKYVIPTLVTFQMTTLQVQASGILDYPGLGSPYYK